MAFSGFGSVNHAVLVRKELDAYTLYRQTGNRLTPWLCGGESGNPVKPLNRMDIYEVIVPILVPSDFNKRIGPVIIIRVAAISPGNTMLFIMTQLDRFGLDFDPLEMTLTKVLTTG